MARFNGILLGPDRPPEPPEIAAREYGTGAGGPRNLLGEPAGRPEPPTRITLPAHFFPPAYGAQSFFPFGTVALMAGPSSQVVTGTELTLQPGFVGIVSVVALALRNMLTTTDARLQLLVNDAAVAPVRRLPAQPVGYIERAWNSFAYLIPPGGKMSLRVTIADAGSYPVTAYYEGWSLSVDDWRRLMGGGA